MYNWINSIWRKYIDSFNNESIPALLIMDQATMHTNENVIKELESEDSEVKFIPKGMTGVLQPLDVAVNIKLILRIYYSILLYKEIY